MALSKRLANRLLTLREQCRAFSSSSSWAKPIRNTPHADVMALLESAQSRAATSKKPLPRSSFLSSQLMQNPAHQNLPSGYRPTDYDAEHTRRWKSGDLVSPRDLSFQETQKWRYNARKPMEYDVFDVLAIDPKHQWTNFSVLGEFVTDMGRIRGKAQTGLKAKNQRKIAKAIRRAVGSGFLPSVHRHPEVLEREVASQNRVDMRMWRR